MNGNQKITWPQVVGVFGVIFLGIYAYVQYNNYIDEEEEKRIEYESNYSNYEEIKFDEIYEEKNENLTNAIDKYEGNVYIFEGTVTRIGEYSVDVEQYFDDYNITANVYFADSQMEYVKDLSKDDEIKFYGKITDINPLFGFIDIEEAIFIN